MVLIIILVMFKCMFLSKKYCVFIGISRRFWIQQCWMVSVLCFYIFQLNALSVTFPEKPLPKCSVKPNGWMQTISWPLRISAIFFCNLNTRPVNALPPPPIYLTIFLIFFILKATYLYLAEMRTKCRIRAVSGGHFKYTAFILISGFWDVTLILLL